MRQSFECVIGNRRSRSVTQQRSRLLPRSIEWISLVKGRRLIHSLGSGSFFPGTRPFTWKDWTCCLIPWWLKERLHWLLNGIPRTTFTGRRALNWSNGSGTHCLFPSFPVLLAPLAHQCRKSSCYRSWNQRKVGTNPFPYRIWQTFVLALFRLGLSSSKSFTGSSPEMLLLTGLKRPGNGHRKNTFIWQWG